MNENELPVGFKRLLCLIDTGIQFINSGIVPTNNTGIYVDAVQNTYSLSFPIGSVGDNDYENFFASRNLKASENTNGYGWGQYIGFNRDGDGRRFISTLNYLNDKKSIMKKSGNGWNFNLSDLSFEPTNEIFLFGKKNNSFIGWNGCIFEAIITEYEEKIRHFIPALDLKLNKPCMYDLVQKKAYYNEGEGEFDYIEIKTYSNDEYNLPAGFQKCVYLQSDGTQIIKTGEYIDDQIGFYIKAQRMNYSNEPVFGNNEDEFVCYAPFCASISKKILYGWNTIIYEGNSFDDLQDSIYSSSLNYLNDGVSRISVNKFDYITKITETLNYIETNKEIYLFNTNLNNSIDRWGGRIYRAKITRGDVLIHDYIPCLDTTGRPCLWDAINPTVAPKYNEGNGDDFIYCVENELPSDFIKIKYIESTGLQYIDSGYIPTKNTGIYVDAYCVDDGDLIPVGMRNSTGNTRFFVGRVVKTNDSCAGWGNLINFLGRGVCRFESYLNWLNDKMCYINAPIFNTNITSLGSLPFTPAYTFHIFGINQMNENTNNWKGRIYRVKISEGTEIVRDFVPAYNSYLAKPCLYDINNNIAYYNDGQGDFLYDTYFEGSYTGMGVLNCIGNRLGVLQDDE